MTGRHQSPIERFLGADAARGGPFGLLRLTPETCNDERIIASLEWQLDRVAQHAEADTPEADEVRLALHAAAAQLLDPVVRKYVLQSLQPQSGDAPWSFMPREEPPAPSVRLTGLEQEAIRTLAAHGGWNRQSMERLKALAAAKGLGSREVALTIQNLSNRRAPGAKPAGVAGGPAAVLPAATAPQASAGAPAVKPVVQQSRGDAAREEPRPTFVDTGDRYVHRIMLLIGGGIVGIIGLIAGGALLLTLNTGPKAALPPPPPTATAPLPRPHPVTGSGAAGSSAAALPDEVKPPTGNQPAGTTTRSTQPEPLNVEPLAIVRGLAECATQARRDPEGVTEKFVPLVRTLASRWCRLDPAQRRAADGSVLDVVFATASHPETAGRVLDCIRDGALQLGASEALNPGETWAAAWSVGIMTRIARERELPHSLSSEISAALSAAIGQDRPRSDATFEAGAMAAIRRIPERLLAGPPAAGVKGKQDAIMRPWLDAVTVLAGTDAELKERVLVDALQRILTAAAEPSEDQRVYDAVQVLATEIKWRRGGVGRTRLLDWFKDARVSMQDMQVLTSVLASRSSAEGVDSLMVLSAGSTSSDRQRLRSAYAKAWGIAESMGENKASAEWLRVGQEQLERTASGARPAELLAIAATYAKLNEAATRLWRGETEKAADATELAVSRAPASGSGYRPGYVLLRGSDADGQWAVSYMSMGRNVALREEKLLQMEKHTATIGPVDAEHLVSLACYESPVELRTIAQRAVFKFGNEPVIVNAMLEILPRAPRYSTVGAMFERVASRQLPPPTDQTWELETRRALIARLLELLASAGEDAAIDDISRVIFEAYVARAGLLSGSQSESGADSSASKGAEGAAVLCRIWREDAEAVAPNEYSPVPLDVIDRRRQGRQRLAQGPVQSFAAQQVTTVELMAYVITAEQPRLAKQAGEVIEEMAKSRRESKHIFEQMVHAERAMLRLWRLRIAGDKP